MRLAGRDDGTTEQGAEQRQASVLERESNSIREPRILSAEVLIGNISVGVVKGSTTY